MVPEGTFVRDKLSMDLVPFRSISSNRDPDGGIPRTIVIMVGILPCSGVGGVELWHASRALTPLLVYTGRWAVMTEGASGRWRTATRSWNGGRWSWAPSGVTAEIMAKASSGPVGGLWPKLSAAAAEAARMGLLRLVGTAANQADVPRESPG